jgi:hypothetical protein
MPKSKTRKKRSGTRRSYVPQPVKKKPRKSPRWYPFLVLGLLAVGVLIIVLNYMGLMFGTHGNASGMWLWGGLAFIAAGFMAATQLR